ncbi:LuxR C-terminal-related transcriptional regulator [Phaeobacter marinintestinus]|uniref:LuxR C-terminal-related transcriptional regulator n=1 Tax=Falsiphaeobacter marinintestinus TaxID=1492905 RepID=UPI00164478F9|nr:LuxR C-terminal-related transcriptional regulator [Phaeobacter marinintestinus]
MRTLVEGADAKAIAAERGTSEGTVRGQIKSILGKMHARTQSEVIRFALSLRDVSESAHPGVEHSRQKPVFDAADWPTVED